MLLDAATDSTVVMHNQRMRHSPLPVEAARLERLKELADARFGAICSAEEEILRLSSSSEETVSESRRKKGDVRASFIRWLITDKDAVAQIDPRGLRIDNAKILANDDKSLDLTFCAVPVPIFFLHCRFPSRVMMPCSSMPGLYFFGGQINGEICCDGIAVAGDFRVEGMHVHGSVSAKGITVGGDAIFTNTKIAGYEESLVFDRARVQGGVYFDEGFEAHGRVSVVDAVISGSIHADSGRFSGNDIALSMDRVNIAGDLLLRSVNASEGEIRVPGAHISGDIDCSESAVVAFIGDGLQLHGKLAWKSMHNQDRTMMSLDGASIGELLDDSQSWPLEGKLSVRGLNYRELSRDNEIDDSKYRIKWLRLQSSDDQRDSHAWNWLASYYRERGNMSAYRAVQCEYQCLLAKSRGKGLIQLVEIILAHLVRNPWRILLVFLPVLVVGTITYDTAGRRGFVAPTNEAAFTQWSTGTSYKSAYPSFNAFVYTLENELPLVKFGMDDKWHPLQRQNGSTFRNQIYYSLLTSLRWFLILSGWLQGIVLSVAINRRFKE